MKLKPKLVLFSILTLGIFLRLFNLTSLFHFTMDEALVAFRGWGLFELGRPFLIGGISPLQVHLPPYFYYLSAFLLAPFKFNPVGWGMFAAIIGLITLIVLFQVVKKITNQKTALVAVLLYATSFTAVFFDRRFWPLSFNPLFTISSLWLLIKLTDKPKLFWPYLGLSAILVFSLTSDPSNIPLIITILIFYYLNRKKLIKKFTLSSLGIAAASFITPLLLFDLRHNFVNLFGVTRLFKSVSNHNFSFTNLINSLMLLPQSLARFWYSPQTNLVEVHAPCIPFANARLSHLPITLVILSLLLIFWFIRFSLKSSQSIFKTIAILMLAYAAGITLFSGFGFSIFDHYLAGLLPIFAFITALILTRLPRLIALGLVAVLVIVNLSQVVKANHPYGLKFKHQLVNWASQELKGQDFALDSISKCHKENGLRYLFELTDNPPKLSFIDPAFFWLYKDPPAGTIPDRVLLVTDKPLTTNLPIMSQNQFGEMSVYILDNSSKQYKLEL